MTLTSRITFQNITQRLIQALPFFLPLYVLRFHVAFIPSTVLELYLFILVVCFALGHGLSGWRSSWKKLGRWRAPMIAWLITGLIAVTVSPVPLAGLGLWRAYFLEPLLVFWIMAALELQSRDRQLIARSFAFTLGVLAIWSAFQFLSGWNIPAPWNVSLLAGRRAVGPFPFPNALALFAAPLGAWLFAHWTNDRRERVALFGWISALVMILTAKSVGGFLGMSVACFVVLLMRRTTRNFALAVMLATGIVIAAVPIIRTPVMRALTFQTWSGQVRTYMWRDTWQMLQAHPIFGAGLGGYPIIFKPFQRTTGIEVFQYPHNILFNFWSETGLLGVVVFVWIIAIWMRSSSSQMSNVKCQMFSLAPLIAILLHGLVDVPYFKNDLAIIFWMLIALTFFSKEISLQKNNLHSSQ